MNYQTTSHNHDCEKQKHVHFLKDFTEEEDGHKHKFQVASLIDSPIDFKYTE
ncbi:MAG: YmaF family protein [Lachnospiraceae bacterium]